MSASASQGRDQWFSAQLCTTCQKQHKTPYEIQQKLKEKRLRSRSTERQKFQGHTVGIQKLCLVSGQNNEGTICLSTLFWRPVKAVRNNGVAATELRRMNFHIPDAVPSLPWFPAITTHHLHGRGSGRSTVLRGHERDPCFSCYLEHHWALPEPFACVSVLFPKLFICTPAFECILFNKKRLVSKWFCTTGVNQRWVSRWNQYFTKPCGEKSLPGLSTPPNLSVHAFFQTRLHGKGRDRGWSFCCCCFSASFPPSQMAWNQDLGYPRDCLPISRTPVSGRWKIIKCIYGSVKEWEIFLRKILQ